MAIILNIDTSGEMASICLARDGNSMVQDVNMSQKDHASWISLAIRKIVDETGLEMKDIEAVAVTFGPGSYTGLRVGLATAKGLCFALGMPLINVNTLEMMVNAVQRENIQADFFCPVIDARRMEVFTAIYDESLLEIVKPCAQIIDSNSFSSFLASGKVLFSGNGTEKLKKVLFHSNALFSSVIGTAADMIVLAEKKFNEKKFADLAYAEPFYLKEFYSPAK